MFMGRDYGGCAAKRVVCGCQANTCEFVVVKIHSLGLLFVIVMAALSTTKRRVNTPFSVAEKESILYIFKTCMEENPNISKTQAVEYTAKSAGAAVRSIFRIISEYKVQHAFTPPKVYTRRRTIYNSIDDETKTAILRRENGNKKEDLNQAQDAQQLPKDNIIQTDCQPHNIAHQDLDEKFKDSNFDYSCSDLQHSTDGGNSCTATDPLSFGIPATKKRKNVKRKTKDTDDEFPMEDLNQYVVKTEPMEFVEEELPIDEKLNPIELKQYMEQQKNPLEDIEQNQYLLSKNNDMNQDMDDSTIWIKKEPILSDINETRHFQDFATQTTFTWEDIKALQDENERLKNENETLKQHILKLQ